jgi:hypothetical protein
MSNPKLLSERQKILRAHFAPIFPFVAQAFGPRADATLGPKMNIKADFTYLNCKKNRKYGIKNLFACSQDVPIINIDFDSDFQKFNLKAAN